MTAPALASPAHALALALARAGHFAEAMAESGAAVATLQAIETGSGRWLGEAALNHAEVLMRAGESDAAATWRALGERELERVWPDTHPRRRALLAERSAP
jgi:hypothetical protein